MKVQFMKKLVPLALITSIAVTNVGITSVAAQTPTNAITQSVEGPVAVENESVSVGDTQTATPVKITAAQATAIEFAGTVNKDVTFYSPYGAEKKVDDAATASVEIENTIKADSDNGGYVEPYANYVGKDKAFYLTSDDAGTTKVAGSNVEIFVADQGTTNPGKVTFRVTVNYGSIKENTGNPKTLYLFADTDTKAKIAQLNLTAKVETTNIVSYEENAKGIVAKYRIVQTNSKATDAPAKYALYRQTPNFNAAGDIESYTPTDAAFDAANGIGGTDHLNDIAGGYIRDLTAEELAALPYTTAKAATEQEYKDLKVGTDAEDIDGKTYQDLKDAVDDETVEWLKGIRAALKDGATGVEQEVLTQANKDIKSILAGITDGTEVGTNYATQLKKQAHDDIQAEYVKTEGSKLSPTEKTTVDEAYIKAIYNDYNLDDDSTLTKLSLGYTSLTTALKQTDAQGNDTYPEGIESTFKNGDVIEYYAKNKNYSDFKTFMTTGITVGGSTKTPYEVAIGESAYSTGIYALDFTAQDGIDGLSDLIEKYEINHLVVKAAGSDLNDDGESTTFVQKSSYIDTKKAEIMADLLKGDYAHKSVLDTASINWITETVNAKGDLASGAAFAKFAVTKNDKTSFAAKTTGDSVIVGATKANKQTNSYVIVKAVSKNYKAATAKTAQKGDVYAQAEFYVTPVASTGFTEKSLSTTAEKPGITFSAPVTATPLTYELKLDEGKSYKLPFALKDGADKTLVYDVTSNAKGFTVVNGTVKAIAGGGSGDIYVYPKTTEDVATVIHGLENQAGTEKADEATALKIHVTTNSAIKTVKATSNNVTMYPGSKQWITFSSNPATDAAGLKYTVTGLDKYDVAWVNAVGSETAVTVNDGTTVGNVLFIKSKADALTEGNTPDKTTKATVKLEKWDATAGAFVEAGTKDFTLNVKWAGAGANAKTVKETYKKVNSDGVVEINVPVGGVVNLGASVNPATADQSIKYIAAKDVAVNADVTTGVDALNSIDDAWTETIANDAGDDKQFADAVSAATGITMNGDVVKAVTEGTYYVKGWTAAKNEKGENLTTNIYKINVYTPGASIIMNDERDTVAGDYDGDTTNDPAVLTKDSVYTIVGGNLMTKAAADTDGDKTIVGGQTITIAEPYTLGTEEEIEWKCNKPSAIRITEGESYTSGTATRTTLDLDLMQAGTFTITGTTKYTKQKFVFKVNVGADATVKTAGVKKLMLDRVGETPTNIESTAGNPATMKVGDTGTLACILNDGNTAANIGLAGTIKFESKNKKVLSVAANGTVKAVGKGETTISATFTSADKKTTIPLTSKTITVNAKTPTISKFTIPSGVSVGKDFNVSAAIKDAKIADCDVKWEYGAKAGIDVTDETAVKNASLTAWSLGNKPSGKVKLTTAGEYLVRLTVSPKGDNNAANKVVAWGVLEAFEKTPTIVNVNNNDADAKKAIAALAAAPKADPDNENGTIGGAGYGVYIIPVFATDKDNSTIDPGDIEWTSSNVSLATAEALVPGVAGTEWEDIDVKTYLGNANKSGTDNTSGSINNNGAGNTFADAVEEENAIIKSANNAYGLVKIVTAAQGSGLTGKVTLTGVLKNSGKKVTVTLNIKNEAKKVVDKYNPIEVTHGNASTQLDASNGFQNIVALKGDEYDKDAVNKLKKGATYTYYAYALVDTTDAKLLKAKPADHIKAINTPGTSPQDKLTYTSADGKYSVSQILAAATTNATAGDTYYLAQVAVTTKVKTAAELNEDGSVKTGGDAVLETTPTKQVITIASQTPVIIK